jgi:hypothetical protein
MTYDFLLLSCHGRPVLAMHIVMLGTLKLVLKHTAVFVVFYMNDDMSLGVGHLPVSVSSSMIGIRRC